MNMMKKLFYCSIVLLFFFLPLVVKAIDTNPGPTQSKEKVEFSLFHSKTCSHCKAEISFIDKKLRSEYGEMVNFNLYEVSESQENQQLFSQYLYFYKAKGGTVPVNFIDGEIIYGYSDDKTSGARLKEVIEQKLRIKGWSGVVYFVFMAAWLHFLLFIGMIFWVRMIIGTVGIGVGGKNLWDYWKNRKADGVVCEVSSNKKTQTTFEKIKDIVHRQGLWWSILGIVILGFSVNLVELACSAGFPAIYTQVLALNGLPMWQKYLYMLGYIFFYMLDDMIVFTIAAVTLKSRIVGGKFAKYSNLIGGALILIDRKSVV